MLQQTQLSHAEERESAARKMAEASEVRRQEAEERRRAQELLIDVTSHELRQPVSAILNCAALVRSNYQTLLSTLKGVKSQSGTFTPDVELLGTMEADLEALGKLSLVRFTRGSEPNSQSPRCHLSMWPFTREDSK